MLNADRSLHIRLQAATRELHAAAAACYAAGKFSQRDVHEERLFRRQARVCERQGEQAVEALIEATAARANALRNRLKQTLGPATESVPSALPSPATEAPRIHRRADELNERHLELLTKKHELVVAIINGTPMRDALRAAQDNGLECSERSARNYVTAFRSNGYTGLLDGRSSRRVRKRRVMTDAVQQIVLDIWINRPAAGPSLIWRLASAACRSKGISPPGRHIVWRFLREQRSDLKTMRVRNREKFDKEYRPVVRFTMATAANERFQLDHTRIDVWAKRLDGDVWRPTQVWCTAAIDEFSRSVAGFIVSTEHPNSWQVALLLRQAILKKGHEAWHNRGLPRIIQIDRGRDFTSQAVRAACVALGITIDPDPPHYPNRKGKIERWFRTLDTGCLRGLRGHMGAIGTTEEAAAKRVNELLTIEEIRAAIERFVVEDYHAREHRELGATPREVWLASIGMPRMPESEDALQLFLMQSKVCTVMNDGIHFSGGLYWAPPLAVSIKRQVRVRYDPSDLGSVYVYDAESNAFITEAFAMGGQSPRYGVADVQAAARESRAGVRSLLERSKARADDVARRGRVAPAATATPAQAGAASASGLDGDPLVEAMRQSLEQALRST